MDESDDFDRLLKNAVDRIKVDMGDKNNFLGKIDQVSNFTEKLKILLQFLGSDFTNTKLFYVSHDINTFLQQIFLIVNECPLDFNLFMKWLPNFIANQNKTITDIRRRVSRLQKHVQDLISFISSLNDVNNINEFKNKENQIISDIKEYDEGHFNKENEENSIDYLSIINNLKSHITKLKIEMNKIEEREKNENHLFVKLNEQLELEKHQNEQYQAQIESYKSKTAYLISNIDEQKQKLDDIQAENIKIKKLLNQNENSYKSQILLLKKEISLLQTQSKQIDQNNDLNHLNELLQDSQKKVESLTEKQEIYENLINELKSTESQTNALKDQLLLLNEENNKIKNENEENKKNLNICAKTIQKLKISLNKTQMENQKLKVELQSVSNSSSSSLQDTIDRLTIENDELKKAFLLNNETNKLNVNNEKMQKNNFSSQLNSQINSFSSANSNEEDSHLMSIVDEKNKEINCLKRKLHLVEAEKFKIANSLKKFQIQNNSDSNDMDLKKIGFLLADALCQRYNPSRYTFEIKRLIEIVRFEHISLYESARVPLDPFNQFIDDTKLNPEEKASIANNKNSNLFSGFDELDRQLSSMKTYI